MLSVLIRRAEPADARAVSGLTEARRVRYERYQPVFWRRAENSRAIHEEFLRAELAGDELIAYVLEAGGQVRGFVSGRFAGAPEVYAPGGETLLVDDFVVEPGEAWGEFGPALLERIWADGRSGGAAQMVVVCGHRDEDKRQMLRSTGLSIASEWWVGTPAEPAREPQG